MDRAWMDALRTSEEYQNGVEEFIEFAKRNVASKNGKYPCPCVKCVNVDRKSLDSIRNDLICEGINRRYRKWICQCLIQRGSTECGYYVCKYMLDIVYQDFIKQGRKFQKVCTLLTYISKKIVISN